MQYYFLFHITLNYARLTLYLLRPLIQTEVILIQIYPKATFSPHYWTILNSMIDGPIDIYQMRRK